MRKSPDDLDGNMTFGPLPGEANFVTYSFDARNRLTGVGGVTYTYDSENNRISKTTPDGITTYIFDPHGDALPRVLVRELPDDSLTYYVYGIGLLYEVDETDNATYYHFDQSGSTMALTNDAGTVTDRVEYTPYGTVSHRTGTTDTPFLYAGQFGIQADPNGLFHMRARYYSPELKRFINADPAGFDGGMNWYAYGNNSPLMYVDPDGEHPILVAVLIGAVIGSAVDAGFTAAIDYGRTGSVDWGNIGRAAIRGAIVGGLSTIATPAAGSTIVGLRKGILGLKIATRGGATGSAARGLGVAYTGLSGSTGQIAYNALDSSRSWHDGAASAFFFSAGGSMVASRAFPVTNQSTFKQFTRAHAFPKYRSTKFQNESPLGYFGRIISQQNSGNFLKSSLTSGSLSATSGLK